MMKLTQFEDFRKRDKNVKSEKFYYRNTSFNIWIQCPPLNRITLGQHKSDNTNRMIQLTEVFCVLLRYNGTMVC